MSRKNQQKKAMLRLATVGQLLPHKLKYLKRKPRGKDLQDEMLHKIYSSCEMKRKSSLFLPHEIYEYSDMEARVVVL